MRAFPAKVIEKEKARLVAGLSLASDLRLAAVSREIVKIGPSAWVLGCWYSSIPILSREEKRFARRSDRSRITTPTRGNRIN